jgi:hypothetical protein
MGVPAVVRGEADRCRGVRLWAMKNAGFVAVTAALLLAGSGHLGWRAAWAYLGYLVAYLTLLGILLYRLHPTCWPSGRECRRGPNTGTFRWPASAPSGFRWSCTSPPRWTSGLPGLRRSAGRSKLWVPSWCCRAALWS